MRYATILTLTFVSVAQAMAQDASSLGASVRIGMFWPVDGSVKTIAGKQWTTFGLDYRIKKLGSNNDGSDNSLSLSLDFFQKSSFRNTPVLLNYVSESGQMYYFIGGGAGFTKMRNDENENENRIRPAYQFGLGYKFDMNQMPTFVELKWVGSTEAKFNGWGIYAGVRF
ncbi:MAG: hypothetical protein IT205_06245 [Fimbriimonadaceae bacterium]|nr:hypothetical protein [Fimbriimonadaceae bacterium]